MDSPHIDQPYPPHSRSIYHLSTTPSAATRSPVCSPSHHIFPSFDSTAVLSSFLAPSPTASKLPSLHVSTAAAFTFPPHPSLLPPCPLSPCQSLFDNPSAAPTCSPTATASTDSYSHPASPVPADAYIASILSSPNDYAFSTASLFNDDLNDALCDAVDVGCVVFGSGSSPSSPTCTSPWSNGFEVSGGEGESGSGSGGSDSEGRGEGAGSDGSSMAMTEERDSQPTTDDDESGSAATPTSPPSAAEPTKRRRQATTKQLQVQQQEQQPATKPAAEKGRKRRLTATAPPQFDANDVPEDKRERNKQSASDYRKRRKLYVVSLEQQLSDIKAALRQEREEGKKLRGENTVLRASMQMMREFVQGKATPTTRREEKEAEKEHDENDSESAEAVKRWEAAVSVRVPEEYRPVAPSQKKLEEEVEEGATHTHNTRKRRGRPTTANKGQQHKVGLTLFVLFSCFLLYFPWLSDLSSLSPSPSLVHAPAGESSGDGSLFYSAAPDCAAQPDLCHRGRTILKLMESDVNVLLDEQQYAAAAAASHMVLEQDEPVVDVKVEPRMDAELTVDEIAAVVMSPLSLPVSAHNASAALAWLGEDDDSIEQLLMMPAASPSAFDSSEYEDGSWAAAGYSGTAQQAV